MKKFLAMVTVLVLACGVQADSYLYWMLDAGPAQVKFAYARLLAEDAGGGFSTYLTMGDSDISVTADALTSPNTISLNPIYSMLPASYDIANLRFLVELYGTDQTVVGTSSYASYSALQEFIYEDMGTSGIRSPYHFTSSIPEPSGGILMLFGFGVLALRRKKSKLLCSTSTLDFDYKKRK